MANWANNSPDETTNYITVLTNLKDRDKDSAKLFSADPTNPEDNFFRYNRAANKFQEYLTGVWTDKILSVAGGGTGATSASGIRTSLGLGTMALQNDNAVNITGGAIGGSTAIPATNITSGIMAQARLGNGATGGGVLYLADNQTWNALPSGTPVGVGFFYFGYTIPPGYLLCDGSAVSRATYTNLFTVIGTIYGAGDGSSTFNLPNLVMKFPLGAHPSIYGIGVYGGSMNHTHGIFTDGYHTHTTPGHQHTTDVHAHAAGGLGTSAHSHGGDTGSAGSHTHGFGTGGPSSPTASFQSGPTQAAASTGHTHSGTTNSEAAHIHSISSSTPSVTGTTANAGGGLTSVSGVTTSDPGTPPSHGHGGATDVANPPYLSVYYIIKY